jgi:cell division protein ZapA
MAQVVVAIAGRTYRMACEDGQEAHIEALAALLDQRMEEMRGNFGEIGEQRLSMMTALGVIDELDAARRQIMDLQAALNVASSREAAVTQALEEASARLAKLAGELDGKR